MNHLQRNFSGLLLAPFIFLFGHDDCGAIGVPVTYQLPVNEGAKTYLVSLAIVDSKNPDWIISTFVAGAARTVTLENQGRFTETWDGLDENFMPAAPGDYALKGIYSPAKQWRVDGEWHAITPRFAGGVSPWLPSPEQWDRPVLFGGDPVNAPLADVAVGPNGVAVFYYEYLENGTNCPMFDLKKPVDYGQFMRAFGSGGAGGGSCVATDGKNVWAFSTDGGPKYVYRADGKSFGKSPTANRTNGYLPEGWVTAMAVSSNSETSKAYLYVAQRGRIETKGPHDFAESRAEFVDTITIHAGEDGTLLDRIPLPRPQALAVQHNRLYALHAGGTAVSAMELKNGLPIGNWHRLFDVPSQITAADLEVDRGGRLYLSDRHANKVFQLDAGGLVLRTFGRLDRQTPGNYDPETLMEPGKLATWTDAQGKERLIIVECAGPNRVSEWSADEGKLLREFPTYQTKCNNGYAVDPDDTSLIYLPGQGDWLTRYKVNFESREWKVDAVWPGVESGERNGLSKPVAIRANGQLYLASEKSLAIYRLAKDGWIQSAGLIQKGKDAFFWNDANGNGQMEKEEMRPCGLPAGVITYHGQKWLPDFSYIAPAQGGKDVWRLAPEGFDVNGNPIFNEWKKTLTDPIFEARAAGMADAVHGGNELSDDFSSDWMQSDGSMADGFYVQARGKGFDANHGAQHKISRYVPDGTGGYRLKWRVGRSVLQGSGLPGELQGGMRLFKPLNGLLTIVDQTRSGLLLYTNEGIYVDTLFPESSKPNVGIYAQPGEFFAGTLFGNQATGKIYYGSGKYTPLLYEMEGWSLTENPVLPLTTLQKKVTITSAQIAVPPEMAISLRGGAGKARVVRFSPALGGAALDGSLIGWEATDPVEFSSGSKRSVEVRCLYDPDHLFLRWHVRLGSTFAPATLPPLERLFTHDQGSDTVGFYIQGDVGAAPHGPATGRPGDARFVFGLFKNGDAIQPAAAALYPFWEGKDARPQTYRTPVGEASFAHVDAITGLKSGYALDADGQGFVLTVALPRTAIPSLKTAFGSDLRTLANFDANLGGHDKFWWANTDGSANRETYDEPSEARLYTGSWAPLLFQGIDDGVTIRNWLLLGPFGGPGAEKFSYDPRNKEEVKKFYEDAVYPPDDGKVDPKALFEGSAIAGYWKNNGKLHWTPASIADLDSRVTVGGGSQLFYGTTWIYAPDPTDLEFAFQSHPMTYLRWFLNRQQIVVDDKDYKGADNRPVAVRAVTLNQGWNQVQYRGYAVGYPPFRVGLVLKAPPAKLWPLRFSITPDGR
ncbi:MAG: hypothetical protein JWL59_2908 [Chthoniobacteraceae bacterium]|nr:hypothetical protein [Chthoniobacteraceae bacterium]